ncbi:MAG: ATP-binding protein, partial [Chloroflexi bacterium]
MKQQTNKTEPELVELHLPSVLGYEKVARSAAEAIALRMEFSSDRIEDLKTAVAEAC